MIPTARAMRTALPASGSADNAFLIATVPMPASPITSAAMRAALPDMARAPAAAGGGGAGATAARGEGGWGEDLGGDPPRRERDEHGVDEQLVVESAARRGPDQLGHGHEEADVDAQKAYVRERGVGRRHAADQLVVAPDELAGQEQDAAGADPYPGAPLVG